MKMNGMKTTGIRRIAATMIFLMAMLSVSAQPETTRMTAGRTTEGIVYFLPKTNIRFHLLVEKKTYTPGEYAKYAEKYMQLQDIQQEEEVTCRLAGYTISPIGVRDTSKCFNVKLKGGKCETAEIMLSDDGVLLAVNEKPATPKVRPPFKPAPKPAPKDPRRYLPAEMLTAGSTAKMAELTAQLIYELQERRLMLITGEADDIPQDEQQLQRMIDEIDQEREALMSLFTGTVTRDTTEHTLVVSPTKEVEREIIFRFSRRLGIVDKDDLSGVPYYMTIRDPHHTDQQKYPMPESKKPEGFYVNVPTKVHISLMADNHDLVTYELPMAQFGFVELREGALFKRYVTHMTLNPTTGAIERVYADMDAK